MKNLFSIISLAFVFFISCKHKNTFLAEPYDPRLPILSMQGNNMLGCYVNEKPYISPRVSQRRENASLRKIAQDSIEFSHFILPMENKDTIWSLNNLTLKFILPIQDTQNGTPMNKNDLIQYLGGKSFSLDGQNAKVSVRSKYYPQKGNIQFLVTKGNILAGTFYFEIQDSTSVTKFTSGRFDFSRFN